MNSSLPLISCICFTENHPLILQRAISCFEKQDYPNKELVISYPDDDFLTKNLIDQIAIISDISLIRIERSGNENHNTAKNEVIKAATGQYICIWDDHSWYHKSRLHDQYHPISSGSFKASILKHLIFFNYSSKKSYSSPLHHWEESLLCEKNILLQQIKIHNQWEVFWVFDHLIPTRSLCEINDKAHLIVHICHESNSSVKDISHLQNWPEATHLNQILTDQASLEYYLL